ncbi:MAG: hypothetical protein ACRDT4_02110 [Micromonosporaceae bacterium]
MTTELNDRTGKGEVDQRRTGIGRRVKRRVISGLAAGAIVAAGLVTAGVATATTCEPGEDGRLADPACTTEKQTRDQATSPYGHVVRWRTGKAGADIYSWASFSPAKAGTRPPYYVSFEARSTRTGTISELTRRYVPSRHYTAGIKAYYYASWSPDYRACAYKVDSAGKPYAKFCTAWAKGPMRPGPAPVPTASPSQSAQ